MALPMKNATAFVTGASRGLGKAIVSALVKAGFSDIIAISRSSNRSTEETKGESGGNIEWVSADLASESAARETLVPVFQRYNANSRDPIVLINNAGIIEPIGPLGTVDSDSIERNLHVNLTAPALLCNEFLRVFADTESRRVIINVTSGLAKRTMTGVASYSTSKAGLDMLTAAIATEQTERAAGSRGSAPAVEAYGVSPGTVATDMQKTLRASSESDLPARSKFVALFEQGELYTPEYSSNKIVNLVLNPGVNSGSVVHVRDL